MQLSIASLAVKDNLAVEQIVPHSCRVAIVSLMFQDHRFHFPTKIIQITVDKLNLNAILEHAVIFQLPELIAILHVRTILIQHRLTLVHCQRLSQININIVV